MRQLFLIFFIIFINGALAQNLVHNYSFESYINCPVSHGQIYLVTGWITPSIGSPDYYNFCSSSDYSTPSNIGGFQTPFNEQAYIGIYTYNIYASNIREYIQTELTDSLIKNENYYVEYYVSLSDYHQYANNTIGAFFSEIPISNFDEYLLSYEPQVKNTNSSLAVKDGWVKVSGTFKANGGEKYLTIGNFMPDSLSDTLFVGGGKPNWNAAYYYIDAVTVMLDTTVGESEKRKVESEKFRLYPNPVISGNELNIYLSENKGNSAIEIYNVMGGLIYSQPVTSLNVKIKTDNLNKGIYFIKLVSNNKFVDVKKVLVY